MISKTATQMKEEVETKLRRDPRTRDFPIEIFDYNGVFILQGEVPSETISQLVEDIVRGVPGVVSVSNELYVKPN
jgi:hyperosmotically inducible periplasmic protein